MGTNTSCYQIAVASVILPSNFLELNGELLWRHNRKFRTWENISNGTAFENISQVGMDWVSVSKWVLAVHGNSTLSSSSSSSFSSSFSSSSSSLSSFLSFLPFFLFSLSFSFSSSSYFFLSTTTLTPSYLATSLIGHIFSPCSTQSCDLIAYAYCRKILYSPLTNEPSYIISS